MTDTQLELAVLRARDRQHYKSDPWMTLDILANEIHKIARENEEREKQK